MNGSAVPVCQASGRIQSQGSSSVHCNLYDRQGCLREFSQGQFTSQTHSWRRPGVGQGLTAEHMLCHTMALPGGGGPHSRDLWSHSPGPLSPGLIQPISVSLEGYLRAGGKKLASGLGTAPPGTSVCPPAARVDLCPSANPQTLRSPCSPTARQPPGRLLSTS